LTGLFRWLDLLAGYAVRGVLRAGATKRPFVEPKSPGVGEARRRGGPGEHPTPLDPPRQGCIRTASCG
jgi:hypothetical protein